MKLDVTCMRYLTRDDYRVLAAVEQGMRNHELVPMTLISSLANLRHGGLHKFLSNLLRYKLLAHATLANNGYRLSYMGYDILALHTLVSRGVVSSVGSQIGVGKESDIFEALDEQGNEVVLKIHRLGRTSFRSIRRNRDYMQGKSKASWLYMSKLAATKEAAFMKVLYAHGFPTPVPIDHNRHIVVMSRIAGFPMAQIKTGRMYGAEEVFKVCMAILRRLAEHGLVHCDFNEFNLLLDEHGNVTLIDFPQMISISHPNAGELFARDINGLIKFFAMKMRYIPEGKALSLEDIVGTGGSMASESATSLEDELRANGLSKQDDDCLVNFIMSSALSAEEQGEEDDVEDDEEGDDESDGEIDESTDKPSIFVQSISPNHPARSTCDTTLTADIEDEAVCTAIRAARTESNESEPILTVFKPPLGRGDKNSESPKITTAVGDEQRSDDDDDSESVDGEDKSVQQDTMVSQASLERVKERTRRDIQQKLKGKGSSSRNSTKKRNKYGKVVKGDAIDF